MRDVAHDLRRSSHRSLLVTLALAWGFAASAILLVLLVSNVVDRPVGYFTRDPVSIVDQHFYMGLLSNLGAVAWTAAAVTCLLTWLLLGRPLDAPWLYGGLLSVAIGADDLFVLHEHFYVRVVPEVLVPAIYAVALVAFAYRFRDFVLRYGAPLLFAIGLFAISVVTDQLWDLEHLLLEDGTKFIGIVTWAAFFARASVLELGPRLAPSAAEARSRESEAAERWPVSGAVSH